jgi:uncharacterized membrane protein YesL
VIGAHISDSAVPSARERAEHRFARTLELLDRLGDLLLLNLLWLVVSVPVVTIFASTGAMVSVTMRWRAGDQRRPLAAFCEEFRRIGMPITVIGVGWLTAALILTVDLLVISQMPTGLMTIASTIGVAALCVALAVISPWLATVTADGVPLGQVAGASLRSAARHPLATAGAGLIALATAVVLLLMPALVTAAPVLAAHGWATVVSRARAETPIGAVPG